MRVALRYWTLVRIDFTGKPKYQDFPTSQAFFARMFDNLVSVDDVVDGDIQRELLRWYKDPSFTERLLAERCLLCFISWILKQECEKLEKSFGENHNFTLGDLLPYVLDDEGDSKVPKSDLLPYVLDDNGDSKVSKSASFQCFSRQILQSYDSKQSSLSTWTITKFKQHQPLNKFLLECGVYRISNWAILNDTKLSYLTNVLQKFYSLSSLEIQNAECLLQSYHEVYRLERLKERKKITQRKCVAPTSSQLQKIAALIAKKSGRVVDGETVMEELQILASRLREYRIYARGGPFPGESTDAPVAGEADDRPLLVIDEISASIPNDSLVDNSLEENESQEEFLELYRQQLHTSLREAVGNVIESRVEYFKPKKGDKAQQFLVALELSQCQNLQMTEIADRLGMRAQDAVSRLLKLKEFYTDIQQQVLKMLVDYIFNYLQNTNPHSDLESLKELNTKITTAMTEDVGAKTIQTGILVEYLCDYLHTRKN
jgi:hypothetical protein